MRGLILDIDNTIVSRADGQYLSGLEEWLAILRQAEIKVCLLSNNWHSSVFKHRDRLGLPLVRKAMKPVPFAFVRARHKLGTKAGETLVVGDQLITDVLGAKWSGMQVVWVDPLSSTDLWYTQIFRKVERWYLGRMGKSY